MPSDPPARMTTRPKNANSRPGLVDVSPKRPRNAGKTKKEVAEEKKASKEENRKAVVRKIADLEMRMAEENAAMDVTPQVRPASKRSRQLRRTETYLDIPLTVDSDEVAASDGDDAESETDPKAVDKWSESVEDYKPDDTDTDEELTEYLPLPLFSPCLHSSSWASSHCRCRPPSVSPSTWGPQLAFWVLPRCHYAPVDVDHQCWSVSPCYAVLTIGSSSSSSQLNVSLCLRRIFPGSFSLGLVLASRSDCRFSPSRLSI